MLVNFLRGSQPANTRRNGLSVTAIAAGVSLVLAAGNVIAADTPSSDTATAAQSGDSKVQAPATLDAVTVTAQFRAQNMQKTPVAITAINAEMMEKRGQTSVLDIASAAPNVTIKPTVGNYGSGAAVSIRGIGQYDSSFALEPGVGIYIDDVYHPTIFGSAFDLLDLERVEILRGPQGTLAGKNSIGGAVKLYSKLPDETTNGFVEATYGSYGRMDFRGGTNITLAPDKLFMRVSGVVKQRDGHMTRYDYGCRNPGSGVPSNSLIRNCKLGTEGAQDFQGVRAALRWLASENLEINLIADASAENSEPPASKLLSGPDPKYLTGAQEYANYSTYFVPLAHTAAPVKSVMHAKGVAAKVDYKFSDALSLTSITSHRKYDGYWGLDGDGSPLGFYTQSRSSDYEAFSQEFRLGGLAFDERLDYTIGAYYFKGNGSNSGRVEIPRLSVLEDDPMKAESRSVFAHTVYSVNDKFDLSAGVRYTDESKQYTFSRLDPATGKPLNIIHGQQVTYSGDNIDYRISGSYYLDDRTMMFATLSTGFKGGGVNPRPFVPSQVQPFNPETLEAIEVGIKSDLLDNRLRLNGSLFFNRYDDILITITNGYGGFPVSAIPINAGKAEVKGAELEFTAYPTDGLSIDGSVSYLDFGFTSLSPDALASKMNHSKIPPYMSKYKASLGMQYELQLAKGSVVPRLDANFQSSFFTNAANSEMGRVGTNTEYNARVTWRPIDADWEATVGVTNLFDRFYYVNKIDLVPASGIANGAVARPREWSFTVRYNFR